MAVASATIAAGAAVVSAGVGVASAMGQKKAAGKAGAAFAGVGNNIQDMGTLIESTRGLMGDTTSNNRYDSMQSQAIQNMQDQLSGKLSQSTRNMIGMRAVESGAVGLGQGAVNDNYTAWLGISAEQLKQQGVDNYRGYLQQLMGAAQPQQSMNYGNQYNSAAAKAGTAMAQGSASAGMWNGVGQGVGALAGLASNSGMFGGGGNAATNAYVNTGAATINQGSAYFGL